MKYDIEVEGLPDGWELVSYAVPKKGDYYIDSMDDVINGPAVTDWDVQRRIIVRRKVRKYDWSKTIDDVLTLRIGWEEVGMRHLHKQDAHYKVKLAEAWQPNIHGKCPVDPDASVIRVKRNDGAEEVAIAKKFNWASWTIIGWKFEYLADGVEW